MSASDCEKKGATMPHLAGAPCGVCQQPLIGARDGAYCPVCESPIHLDCVRAATADTPPTVCPRCGTLKRLGNQRRQYEEACERERLIEELQHNPDAVAPPVDRSMPAVLLRIAFLVAAIGAVVLAIYLGIPRILAYAIIVVPIIGAYRLLAGSPNTPSHLNPAPPPVSPTKGAWRKQDDSKK